MKIFEDLVSEYFNGDLLGIIKLMSPENQERFAKFLVKKYYDIVYLLENMVKSGYVEASYIRKTLNMEDDKNV